MNAAMNYVSLLTILLIFVLTACGQPGPLYLPKDRPKVYDESVTETKEEAKDSKDKATKAVPEATESEEPEGKTSKPAPVPPKPEKPMPTKE